MRIKQIHMTGYKRFHNLTIDLGADPKRIVALVGPNGCGKSSVFDALLYRYAQFGIIGDIRISRGINYHSLEKSPGYNYDRIKVWFANAEFYHVHEEKRKNNTSRTIFSFRSSFRYNGSLNVKESKAVTNLINNDLGAATASDIDARIEQNYRRLNIKYDSYLNANDCRPSEAKAYIIGELNDAIRNCLKLTIDNLGNVESGNGTLFFRKSDTGSVFPYDVLSAGEKEVVDLLLDLYLRKDVYTDSVYIIDEPELHLNTAIQRKLLIEINKMVPENCQILIATHSIGFLRALQDELNEDSQIIEFEEGNKWASEAYTLTPMVKSRHNWSKLFATALDDLTELVSPKRIIYCEGKDKPAKTGEEQGLDAIVLNTIFGEKYPDTLFVSSGGNTELDQRSDIAIAILSKAISGLEVWVLKDRDMASGKDTTENDRKLYLKNNSPSHRVFKRREIENYLYDKKVLQQYCNEEGLTFDENAYDSRVNNIIDQNLKDDTGRIKNFCGITTSVNQEVFKKNLAKIIRPGMQVYLDLEKEIFNRE